jgi:predicted Zn-dependent protease
MLSFFKKLLEMKGEKSIPLERFLSSHPTTEERIQAMEEMIGPSPLGGDLKSDSQEFHSIREKIS